MACTFGLVSRFFKMASWIHVFLIVPLLLIQGYMNENIHCKEAVKSVETVSSCPTSKEQWDKAASRKKCWEKAFNQTCSDPEKFVYHCVINGYGNATLEVCAPERLILGHCAEFNEVGGVIQDQLISPCSDVFPKCDHFYRSSEAYKYEDCYKLVEAKKVITTTSTIVKHVPSDETIDRDETTIHIPVVVGVSLLAVAVFVSLCILRYRLRNKNGDQKELKEKKIPTVFIKVTGSEDNSEDQFSNESSSSSECRNDNPEVLSESQTLIGKDFDKNTLGVYEVKRRHSGASRDMQ